MQTVPTPLPLLRHVRQIQALSADQARLEYPVKLRGVVTFVDRFPGNFTDIFVQDEAAGVFAFLKPSGLPSPVRVGQMVELTGVSTAGDFSPCVAKGEIAVLAGASLPPPKKLRFDEMLGAKEDGQWAELSGVVRSGLIKTNRLFLNVQAESGSFLAILPDFPADWIRLVDAEVSIRGVVAAIFNTDRQTVGVRLFVPAKSDIHIDDSAPANPFSAAAAPTTAVAQFRPGADPERRIRVRATVTAVDPGIGIYVADRHGVLQVQPAASCRTLPGDLLDVVGFPGLLEGRPALLDAICRRAGTADRLTATRVTADEILPAMIDSDPTGYGLRAGKKYDGRLVSVEGKLLQASHGPAGETLVLASGTRTFTALLPAGPWSAPSLEEGSRILLTGVCLVTFDQYRRGQYFRILARTPADLLVTAHVPWWNLKTALWVLLAAAFLFLAAVAWIVLLRLQVAQRTKQLSDLSMLDPLTEAANRRMFDEVLADEFRRARRSALPVSLLMVDIDHFKALNDSEGHQRGDDCLVEVVRALKSVVNRSEDLVARYGGEEFAVILAATQLEGAVNVAERIRASVEALGISNAGLSGGGTLSVSVGVATWQSTLDEGSVADLLAAADKALYQAKSRGRNRVAAIERESPDLLRMADALKHVGETALHMAEEQPAQHEYSD